MLTSPKNAKVLAATRLKKRSFRDRDHRFLVEGAQAVREGLGAQEGLDTLFTSDPLDPLAVRAGQQGVDVQVAADDVIRAITSTVTPQALVGLAPFRDIDMDRMVSGDRDEPPGCLAILHEVRDPGNAGTVLRSADAAGARGVVFTASSVDVYNPKAVRSSAGSVFHVPVARGIETEDAVARAKAGGYTVVGMTIDGDQDLYRADLSGPIAFLFGNEAHGLPADVVALTDTTVRVPLGGRAESLNLAAAATVCLFEWQRRRSREGEGLETIIAAAAHDIRSPLTAMKGFGYALEKRWDIMSEEQRGVMLQGIVHDADRMDTIVRQLVDAARVVAGSLEVFPEQVDLSEMVLAIADAQRRDPDHPPVLWQGVATTVFVDPARLKTAIWSFIEALVWWAHEGPVRIDAARTGDMLRVGASRAGADLDETSVEALFVPRRPGQGGGSKIGLFVTRGVAQAQGGRAWGTIEGSTLSFHLELPVGL